MPATVPVIAVLGDPDALLRTALGRGLATGFRFDEWPPGDAGFSCPALAAMALSSSSVVAVKSHVLRAGVPLFGVTCGTCVENAARDLHSWLSVGVDDLLDCEAVISPALFEKRVHELLAARLRAELRARFSSTLSRANLSLIDMAAGDPAGAPRTVAAVSRAMSLSRRALAMRARRNCCIPPGHLLGWCRALVATQRLDRNYTVRQTAIAMRFRSASALRNHLKRYTGLPPTELIRRGGLGYVVALFEQAIADSRRRVVPR